MKRVFCYGQRNKSSYQPLSRTGSEAFSLRESQDEREPLPKSRAARKDRSAWSRLINLTSMIGTGGYYPSNELNYCIGEFVSRDRFIDSAALHNHDNQVFVTTAVSSCLPPLPYLFRNYGYRPGDKSRYRGGFSSSVGIGVCASAAAPTYFEPTKIQVPVDGDYPQMGPEGDSKEFETLTMLDGGILVNNPAFVALHEAARLFPGKPIACIASFGTGGSPIQVVPQGDGFLKVLLRTLIKACTNSERPHFFMEDAITALLPDDHTVRYFRYNPEHPAFMVELDETNDELLYELQEGARECIARDREQFSDICEYLQIPRLTRAAERQQSET
jgi:hypothetical protein